MSIATILKVKGNEVATVQPGDSIADVARVLAQRRIGAVVILDAADHLQGILSERDIVRALAEHGARALDLPARQFMTRDVSTVSPHATVQEAMQLMTTGRFRHLPVVEDGEMVGLISIGDVVKSRIQQQDHEVDSLRAYVAGEA